MESEFGPHARMTRVDANSSVAGSRDRKAITMVSTNIPLQHRESPKRVLREDSSSQRVWQVIKDIISESGNLTPCSRFYCGVNEERIGGVRWSVYTDDCKGPAILHVTTWTVDRIFWASRVG